MEDQPKSEEEITEAIKKRVEVDKHELAIEQSKNRRVVSLVNRSGRKVVVDI